MATHECCGAPISAEHTRDCTRFGKEAGRGSDYDAVHPPHYQRGPVLTIDIGEQITSGIRVFTYALQCVEVFRHVRDPRLATAFKYIWRVAFGGKSDPKSTATQRETDERDIRSAIWYLNDWINNPID